MVTQLAIIGRFLARALASLAVFWLELNIALNADLNFELNVEMTNFKNRQRFCKKPESMVDE